jgi:N-methylhydantoinase B
MTDELHLDPITQQVVKNALRSAANEMLLTVLRTAHSWGLREGMDCSTALFDARGRVTAQGVSVAVHLGAMPDALVFVIAKFGSDIDPGDVFICNDPEEGGMHLPDVFLFQPSFVGDRLVGFVGTVGHQKDVGGSEPGSMAVESSEIYQEGLQIPALKFYEAGVRSRAIAEIIGKNSRFPDTVLGDLESQAAACHAGAQALAALAIKYGPDTLEQYIDSILAGTERLLRAGIGDIPDGSYSFTDYLDDDGVGSGTVRISLTITVAGDSLVADFAGTSAQVPSALNATVSICKAAIYTAVQCCIGSSEVLDDAGAHRPIEVRVPKGTILNPLPPAARGARGLTIFRLIDVAFGALHQAVPDAVPAAGDGGIDVVMFSGTDDTGTLHMTMENVSSGWGGSPFGDGIDGTSCLLANVMNFPVEIMELSNPIRVERYGFVQDTAGAGRNRGCVAIERRFRFLLPKGTVRGRADRREHRPYGLAGGRSGKPGSSTIVRAGTDIGEEFPGMFQTTLQYGDLVCQRAPSGGGFGEPYDRDPELVLQDVLDEKVSVEGALSDYGVLVDVELKTAERSTETHSVAGLAALSEL